MRQSRSLSFLKKSKLLHSHFHELNVILSLSISSAMTNKYSLKPWDVRLLESRGQFHQPYPFLK